MSTRESLSQFGWELQQNGVKGWSWRRNYKKCINNIILYKPDQEQIFWHTMKYIDLCARNRVVFNPDKFKYWHEIVEFAGFEVTWDGYRTTQHLLQAITKFPTTRDITGVRSGGSNKLCIFTVGDNAAV